MQSARVIAETAQRPSLWPILCTRNAGHEAPFRLRCALGEDRHRIVAPSRGGRGIATRALSVQAVRGSSFVTLLLDADPAVRPLLDLSLVAELRY